MKKISITQVFLIIWSLSLTIYVVNSTWTDYKTKGVQNAYKLGREDTIINIINKANDSECQVFSVFLREREVKLLNAECLPKDNIDNFDVGSSNHDKNNIDK